MGTGSELAPICEPLRAALRREVCKYRIIPEQDRLRIGGIAEVLGSYQSLVTISYAAVKEGAKSTANVSASSSEVTAMDFSYAMAGSAIFVFTSPYDKDLFDNSHFDDAIRLISEVSAAEGSADILGYARRLGAAPIRALYRWADAHVRSGFSVDIQWKRGEEIRNRLLIQVPEFTRLRQAITETSDEEVTQSVLLGVLIGANVRRKTFHFVTDGGVEIRGKIGDGAIDESQGVRLPSGYKITIRQTTQVRYSTDQSTSTYELLSLEDI